MPERWPPPRQAEGLVSDPVEYPEPLPAWVAPAWDLLDPRSTRPQGDEGVTLVVVTLTEMMMCTSMGYSQGLTLEAKSTVKLCWDRSWSWQL